MGHFLRKINLRYGNRDPMVYSWRRYAYFSETVCTLSKDFYLCSFSTHLVFTKLLLSGEPNLSASGFPWSEIIVAFGGGSVSWAIHSLGGKRTILIRILRRKEDEGRGVKNLRRPAEIAVGQLNVELRHPGYRNSFQNTATVVLSFRLGIPISARTSVQRQIPCTRPSTLRAQDPSEAALEKSLVR